MKFTGLTALFGLAASVLGHEEWKDSDCLTDAGLQRIIDNSIIYLQHTNVTYAREVAYATFAPKIMEVGDSINALRGDPLGTVVASNITKYVGDGLAAPGIPGISTVDAFHTCDRFLWYFEFDGIGPLRVRGVTIGTVDLETGLVTKQVIEFNSLTWAIDVGFKVTPPGAKVRREVQW